MQYIEVEIDLDDYRDSIISHYCENNNCLLNSASASFKLKFKNYIDDLDKDIYLYKRNRNVEDVLRDLEYLYKELI